MQLVDSWIMKRLGPPSAKGYEKSFLFSLLHPYRASLVSRALANLMPPVSSQF